MDKTITVFLDSDVIIASILSKTGASRLVVNHTLTKKIITNLSLAEINKYCQIHEIKAERTGIILKALEVKKINQSYLKILEKYSSYVSDPNDSHVVAGADLSNSRFLLTFNQKHFKAEIIKRDFNIGCLKPGQFLQYMRSQEK